MAEMAEMTGTTEMARVAETADVKARGSTRRAVRDWWRARRKAVREDAGMTTSEYAVGTVAAAAFAAVLYKIVTSGAVSGALESVIGKALDAPF
ncbi:DUF4244 domain-containing protein [Streptomyces sp. NPDC056144]|uniref:DUF4244 domain-containing protein n=1 Tax=unclassified Streptomyces TaxID=2593676 RepID=UPI0035D94198